MFLDDEANSEELRLVNGPNRCSGHLEVLYNQQWGTVCDIGWDAHDAQVVCRELNCGDASTAFGGVRYGQGSGLIWLENVNCTGEETSLAACPKSPWGKHSCNHSQDVSVTCSDARLENGTNPCSGQTELLHNQEWGTMCDASWDTYDDQVVCREFGCGNSLKEVRGAHHGQGFDPIWLEGVNCTGKGAFLRECPQRSLGGHRCNQSQDASVECTGRFLAKDAGEDGMRGDNGREIRLMNGASPCSGRVEVLHNDAWGTICDASWDLQDAQVVCSQLGCGNASKALGGAHYGQGSGPIWLENINCTGEEASLKECQKGGWGEHSCNHSQDASVECSGTCLSQVGTRLVNGTNHCSGRVEVFLDGEWGSVCDDRWGLRDAHVVCRELGCGGALSAPGEAHFGKGNGAIWIDEAHCLGTEVALQKCPFEKGHDCSHKEDAGVVCSEASRLTGYCGLLTGTAPFFTSTTTGGTYLASPGGLSSAHTKGVRSQGHSASGRGADLSCCTKYILHSSSMPLLLPSSGAGYSLLGLFHILYLFLCLVLRLLLLQTPSLYIPHMTEAVVMSVPGPRALGRLEPLLAGVHWELHIAAPEDLRLVNGVSPCSGRVEVLHNDAWGTICDASWDLQDAQVICRELGCGNASKALGGAHYGQGSGPIWLENINCTGEEASLKECRNGGWGEHSCSHSQDASVECSGTPMKAPFILSNSTGTRLVNGTNHCSGRVEVFLDGEWGSVCDHRWDLSDAQVVCRELGCGGALSAPGKAHFGKGNGAIWIDEAQCLGTEVALQKCPFNIKHGCSHKEDAGVVCSGN
nr:deleted in malignant brain tumors 1 protein-like [Anolis sagrei ordinatus]